MAPLWVCASRTGAVVALTAATSTATNAAVTFAVTKCRDFCRLPPRYAPGRGSARRAPYEVRQGEGKSPQLDGAAWDARLGPGPSSNFSCAKAGCGAT